MKRILSIILSVTMVLSLFGGMSLVASAESELINIPEVKVDGVDTDVAEGDSTSTAGITIPEDANYSVDPVLWKYDYETNSWDEYTDETYVKGLYRLEVETTANAGYRYYGDQSTYFYINGEKTSETSGNGYSVAVFEYLLPVGVTAIETVEVTPVVPIIGKTAAEVGGPVKVAEDANYKLGSSIWTIFDVDNKRHANLGNSEVFKNGAAYSGDFTLVPKEGYYFKDEYTNIPSAYTYNHSDATGLVGYTAFGFGYIPTVRLNGFDEPKPGETPQAVTVPEGANYTVNAQWQVWSDEDDDYIPFTGKFTSWDEYRLDITVTATGDNKFFYYPNNGVVTVSTELVLCGKEYYQSTIWSNNITDNTLTYTTRSFSPSYDFDYIYSVHAGDIELPEVGDTIKAVTLPDDSDEYTLSTKWLNEDKTAASGKFKQGKKYYLSITATAKDGYGFGEEECEFYINDHEYDVPFSSPTTATCNYPVAFLPKITELDITVTEPKAGKAASSCTVVVNNSSMYTVEEFTWYDESYEKVTGKFEDRERYYIEGTLLPKKGYVFSDDIYVTVNGEECEYYTCETDKLYFGQTFSLKEKITKVDLIVPEPAVGADIDYDAIKVPDGANYVISHVEWYDDYDNGAVTGKFEDMHKYVLRLEIVPGKETPEGIDDMGYEFAEDLVITINGKALDKDTTNYDRYSDFIDFRTEYSFLKAIDKIELPALPEVAVGYNIDSFTASAPDGANYTVEAEWWMVDPNGNYDEITEGAVQNGNAYTLSIYAKPNTGYEFTDDTEIYAGGKKVSEGRLVWLGDDNAYIAKVYNFGLKEIDRVEITTQTPTIGDIINREDSISIPKNANYTLMDAVWFEHSTEEAVYERPFRGRFKDDKYYTAVFMLEANPGHIFAEDAVVTLNGKEVALDGEFDYFDVVSIWGSATMKSEAPKEIPKTGADFDITPYVVIMLLSGATLIGVNRKRLFGK